MKVLWLSHLIPYPPKGGVLQRSYNMVRELAKYHEVDLLAFNQQGLLKPLYPSLETGLADANAAMGAICNRHEFFELAIDKNPCVRYWLALKGLFIRPYNLLWLESREYAKAVEQWCRDKQYDVIHFDTISLLPYLKYVSGGAATVLDHHNIESHMLIRRAENESNPLLSFYYRHEGSRVEQYEREFCPQFSLNVTCSDVDSERLREIAPQSQVLTVPNGVDLQYFYPSGLEKNASSLIFVGTLNWYPNVEAVIYIANTLWPKLKKLHPDLTFHIVGANPPQQISALAQRDPSFKVHGFVEDIRPMIEQATVYVCPIRDGGGTKLKILDAMAMGAPIVAYPLACEGIEVTPGHDVLFAETDDEFVRQISELLGSPALQQKISRNARKLIEGRFSYEVIGRELAKAFEACRDKGAQ